MSDSKLETRIKKLETTIRVGLMEEERHSNLIRMLIEELGKLKFCEECTQKNEDVIRSTSESLLEWAAIDGKL